MIRIDMSTPSNDRGISARIFQIAPRPVPVEEDLEGPGEDEQTSGDDTAAQTPDEPREDQQPEPQAKVVRSQQRKAPRATVEGVETK